MADISEGFEIGVFAFIRNEKNEVLLARDVTRRQQWTLPGGGLAPFELAPDGACREVYEELGVLIQVERLAGVFTQRKSAGLVMLFDANITSGTPRPDGVETSECGYFSWDTILEMHESIKPAQFSMIHQRYFQQELDIIFDFFTSPK